VIAWFHAHTDEALKRMRKDTGSRFVSLVILFGALTVVVDSIPGIPQFTEGVWYSWIFVMTPITGIVVGPTAGFLATAVGVLIGHILYFRGLPEFLFTLGAPVGCMVAGLLFRGRWRPVLAYYTVLFAGYFLTPTAWQLPVWGMWDTYLAYASLAILALLAAKGSRVFTSPASRLFPLAAFIGLEADVLFRVFLFVPLQTYRTIYGLPVDVLQFIWAAGALVTPVQVALSVVATTVLGTSLMQRLGARIATPSRG
jgi:hypothetical protein